MYENERLKIRSHFALWELKSAFSFLRWMLLTSYLRYPNHPCPPCHCRQRKSWKKTRRWKRHCCCPTSFWPWTWTRIVGLRHPRHPTSRCHWASTPTSVYCPTSSLPLQGHRYWIHLGLQQEQISSFGRPTVSVLFAVFALRLKPVTNLRNQMGAICTLQQLIINCAQFFENIEFLEIPLCPY